MVNGLGLTRREIKKLKETTIDFGDVVKATFEVATKNVGISLAGMGKSFSAAMDWMAHAGHIALAGLYASFLGTFRSIAAIVQDVFSGKGLKTILADAGGAFSSSYKEAYDKLGKFGSDVTDKARENKLKALQKQAAEIKADRTPKVDHHAEQLARENEAIEAQIRNLYALAAAYDVSGAAALIAEARVKAESDAIKKRGDIELFVDRQVRLAIAQRVSDAAKGAAAMRDQARVQTEVNAMVANGLAPASRANELVQERIAELPLLAAIEAAQQRGLRSEVEKATKALEDQRSAAADARAAGKGAFYTAASEDAARLLVQQHEERRLVGVTDAERVRAMATLKATQDLQAKGYATDDAYAKGFIADQVAIADGARGLAQAQEAYNQALTFTADKWDIIAGKVQSAAQGLGDAFGPAGKSIGDLAAIYADFQAQRTRADTQHQEALKKAGNNEAAIARENQKYALASTGAQIAALGDAAAAAKGLFKEGSAGYKAMGDAEKAFRAIQFALSIRAMAQDAIETGSALAKSAARTAAHAVEAVVKAISSLPFPFNLAAGAATIAALAAIGVSIAGSFGGSSQKVAPANTGTGTVLGDGSKQSESIKNSLSALKDVNTLMLGASRQMVESLKSIDSQIGSFAAQIVKGGPIDASDGITTGFKTNTLGNVLAAPAKLLSNIPIIGGLFGAIGNIIGSLFGTRTDVTGSGLYGGPQSLGQIESSGFNGQSYSDVQKTKKFLGVVTGRSTSTQYGSLNSSLNDQFTLILKSFDQAIAAAAGPLGDATDAVQARLNGFVVNIGKIDLTGLTGDAIQSKLEAIFGALGDQMATYVYPEITRFQKVGEGALETLVRVASTVETVTAALDKLGAGTKTLGIDAKLGIAGQFDSLSDLTSAGDAYFQAFYTKEEQAAAKFAQLGQVFDSLGLQIPASLASYRQLVDAQDLTTAAGQQTYATLLKLAPAFADVQAAMEGAKSAADIASERSDLQRQLLELQGDTAALRALDLAKLDASNRELQQQVWAVQDAQKAAEAAQQLRDAWTSVGDSIMDEVKRIRGLSDAGRGSFAQLQGQFNAATSAARAGDQDAAKSLPGLSQALLTAAAAAATSRQELDRVQAATASSLETTKAAIDALTLAPSTSSTSTANLLAAAAATQATSPPAAANDDMADELRALREEVAQLRSDNNAGHAATASKAGSIDRRLEAVTADSGGQAVSVASAA